MVILGEKVHPIITRRSGSYGLGGTVSRKPSQNLRELTGNYWGEGRKKRQKTKEIKKEKDRNRLKVELKFSHLVYSNVL